MIVVRPYDDASALVDDLVGTESSFVFLAMTTTTTIAADLVDAAVAAEEGGGRRVDRHRRYRYRCS